MRRMKFTHLALLPLLSCFYLMGCKGDLIHTRPMAELTQKAQALMAAGDYDGAIARLESAHDLNPSEPTTTYNLALAYQAANKPLKGIPLLTELIDKHPAGIPKEGELKKLLGMLWEQQGDLLSKSNASDSDKSALKAPSEPNLEAKRAYATAIDFYTQALQGPGLSDSESVKAQINALKANQLK